MLPWLWDDNTDDELSFAETSGPTRQSSCESRISGKRGRRLPWHSLSYENLVSRPSPP
jgi:hypothetical protein